MEIKLFIPALLRKAIDGGKDQMTWRNLAEPFCPSLVDPGPCHTAEIDLTSGSGFDMSGRQTDAELKV